MPKITFKRCNYLVPRAGIEPTPRTDIGYRLVGYGGKLPPPFTYSTHLVKDPVKHERGESCFCLVSFDLFWMSTFALSKPLSCFSVLSSSKKYKHLFLEFCFQFHLLTIYQYLPFFFFLFLCRQMEKVKSPHSQYCLTKQILLFASQAHPTVIRVLQCPATTMCVMCATRAFPLLVN